MGRWFPKASVTRSSKTATSFFLQASYYRPKSPTPLPATGISMPQPAEGHGGRDVDVVIRGIISADGRVHEAVVQSAENPDLGNEALALVRQWTFTPARCDGEPNDQKAEFLVHFHGR